MTVDGLADYNVESEFVVTPNVILIGGDHEKQFTYAITPIGGITINGKTTTVINPVIQGGINTSGLASEITSHNIPTSGGIVVSGVHTQRFYDFAETYGGLQVSGISVREDPVCHVEGAGEIEISGTVGVRRLSFYISLPNGEIVFVDGTSEESYGLHYTGFGSITMGGTSRIDNIDYGYRPRGKTVIVEGDSDSSYYQVPGGGTSLGGSASLDDFVYKPTGQTITVSGNDTLRSVSYEYTPKGRIVFVSGSSVTNEWPNIIGSSMCSGEAEVNTLWYNCVGNGEIIVGGENKITYANFRWSSSGRIILIDGTTESLPGQYRHDGDGEVMIGGVSNLEFTYHVDDCPHNIFKCKIVHGHSDLYCPETMYFYNDTRIYEDPFYDPTSKGMLPSITICRQRLIIPSSDRHPEVPKQKS